MVFFFILHTLEYNQILALRIVLFIRLCSYNICSHTYIIVHLYLNYTNKMNLMTLWKLQGSNTWYYKLETSKTYQVIRHCKDPQHFVTIELHPDTKASHESV
jgi:cytochrome b subunit of formate dehydrogenase